MSAKSERNSVSENKLSKNFPTSIVLAKEIPTQSEKDQCKFIIEHVFIKWSIENFPSFPRKDDKFAVSPTFTLKDTWWYLTFHPTAKILGINHIVMNLFRHKADQGPKRVTVSYRLGLESGDNKVWFNSNESFIFEKSDCYGMQTSVFEHLEDFTVEGAHTNNALAVLCEMYISYLNPSETKTLIYPMDLKLLSTDLCNIFYSKQCTDVLIEVSDFSIKAHKSVLCARSRTLSKMLENRNSCIRFSWMSKSCLICLLLYIYSGEFDFLARNAVLSIGLHECAYKLSLTGLMNLLIPTKIELKTRVTVEELEATWSICNFSLKEIFNKGFFHSPEFNVLSSDDVNIKFYVRTLPLDTDFINIDAEISGMTKALDISIKILLWDKNSKTKKTAEVELFKESDVIFTTSTFLVKDILSCVLDDTLVISCSCKRYSLKGILDSSVRHHGSFKSEDTWIEDLSDNLQNLCKAGTLSDVTLKTGEKEFKLHRSILSARSRIFCQKFLYNQYKHQILTVSDIEPHILELMVEYVYCGKINRVMDVHLTDALRLYEVAGKYHVGCLKSKCASLVSSKLNKRNAFHILSWAEQHEDLFMISMCMTFINRYFKLAVDPDQFENIKKTQSLMKIA